jgi:hypothetical protein
VLPAASVASEMVTAGHLLVAREVKAWMSWNCKPQSKSGTVGQRNQRELASAAAKLRLSPCVQPVPGTAGHEAIALGPGAPRPSNAAATRAARR